jgi:DNA processing protein
VPTLPEEAFAAALASLPGVGPRTLRRWLDAAPPSSVWHRLAGGALDPRWREPVRSTDVGTVWERHRRHGVAVARRGGPGYPVRLAVDEEAPAVLFSLGDPTACDRAAVVSVVGTRSATRYGLGVAAQLGGDLAAAGVVVVSGLALGVDGAAHEGAVAAWECGRAAGSRPPGPPVGVVAGGLDRAYPRRHALLWRRVAAAGAVLSEAPVGAADLRWRFPQRNRIMAALADAVVVVECHAAGGSLHTVRAAARRGVAVGAVPGSVRSPASAGTNDLLADGCFVVRDVTDVLVAVGLARAADRPAKGRPTRPSAGAPDGDEPGAADQVGRRVLDVLDGEPCPIEEVLRRTGLRLDEAAAALEQLQAAGVARGTAGWWERA